jgi:hypothetical protein
MPGDSYPAGFFRMLILAMTSLCCYDIPSIGLDYFNNLTDFQDAASSSLDISWMYLLIRFLCQAPSPKISGTRTSRCPLMFRTIVKRPAMTGSRLGRCAETRPAPGFRRGRVGPGPSGSGGADTFPVPITFPKVPVIEILRAPKMPTPAKPGLETNLVFRHYGHHFRLFRKVLRENCT